MSYYKIHDNEYVNSFSATTYYSGSTELSTLFGGGGSGVNSPFSAGSNSEITTVSPSANNKSYGNFSFSVGLSNKANGHYSAVVGGAANSASTFSFVAGGRDNFASSTYSFIAAGQDNITNGFTSSIAGGQNNLTSGNYAFIGAGLSNSATTRGSIVVGGGFNLSSGVYSSVSSGRRNESTGSYSCVSSGLYNESSGPFSIAAGGLSNVVSGAYGLIVGGKNGTSTATGSAVIGGSSNDATAVYSTAIGGVSNTASYSLASVIGGYSNTASGTHSFVGGGNNNSGGTYACAIVGGSYNRIAESGLRSFIGGGSGNTIHNGGYTSSIINSISSTIAGNAKNSTIINSRYSFVGQGQERAVVIGGSNNTLYQGSMDGAVILGSDNTLGGTAYRSIIIGGTGNSISTGVNSILIGTNGVTSALDNTVYVPKLRAISGASLNDDNLSAIRESTSNPTVNDDSSAGFYVGYKWVNTTTDAMYVCTDATSGSSVWKSLPVSNSVAFTYFPIGESDNIGYSFNTVQSLAFVPEADVLVSHIGYEGSNHAGGMQPDITLGIYDDNDSLIASTNLVIPYQGRNSVQLITPITLSAGEKYFMSMKQQGAGAQNFYRSTNLPVGTSTGWQMSYTTSGLPATATRSSATDNIPYLFVTGTTV